MNIFVYAVPAEIGGALTILKEHYTDAVQSTDKEKKWFFVVSLPELVETENVKVIRLPWIKKSWLHRLYFDYFVAHKLAKRFKADEILSLQNVTIQRVGVPQTVYVHQPLPFIDKKFKASENFLFWVYQNIIGKKIIKSIKSADKVIVQTNWMKDACVKKANISATKVSVSAPKINIEIKQTFDRDKDSLRTFFYPASGLIYKNHQVIVEASLLLKMRDFNDFKIVFTLQGNESKHITRLYKIVKEYDLPIEFIGSVSHEQVFEYYSRSILLFPSYVETYGLPMAEAKMCKTAVLASDCPFSHEILDGYDDARFLDPVDPEMWATSIKMLSTSMAK